MGLADRVKVADLKPEVNKGPDCEVRKAAKSMSQEDADALLALVFDRLDLSAAQVSRFLADDEDEPVLLSQSILARHRRGECTTCRR